MSIADTVTDLQNTMFDQVLSFQNKIVDLNRDLAGRFGEGLEKAPGMTSFPGMAAMPGVPGTGLPMVQDAIEANKAVMDNLFSWSTKLIEAQRGFTTELLSIWAPVPAKAAAAAREGVNQAAQTTAKVTDNVAATVTGKSPLIK
ncbi:MAG: hypothetical protein ACKV2O_04030 [Acidimicrobiales bacterium]